MTAIHKEVFGQGGAVVMLHGWAMHSGFWRGVAQQLATDYQVSCLDLCGHGRSATMTPYTLETLVDALITAFPEEACVLIGWSLGGNIALRLQEKYPERVSALILLACNPHFLQAAQWPGIGLHELAQFKQGLSANTLTTLWRFISLQLQNEVNLKPHLKKLRRVLTECPVPTLDVLERGLDILRTEDGRARLSALNMPVQCILGAQDTLVPLQVGESCLAIQPELDVQVIQGAGHMPFITHEKTVLAIIKSFIVQQGKR